MKNLILLIGIMALITTVTTQVIADSKVSADGENPLGSVIIQKAKDAADTEESPFGDRPPSLESSQSPSANAASAAAAQKARVSAKKKLMQKCQAGVKGGHI